MPARESARLVGVRRHIDDRVAVGGWAARRPCGRPDDPALRVPTRPEQRRREELENSSSVGSGFAGGRGAGRVLVRPLMTNTRGLPREGQSGYGRGR